jgi:hypothetical protein
MPEAIIALECSSKDVFLEIYLHSPQVNELLQIRVRFQNKLHNVSRNHYMSVKHPNPEL